MPRRPAQNARNLPHCRPAAAWAVPACGALLSFWAFVGTSSSSAAEVDKAKLPPPAARAVDFEKDVRPIFAAACYKCHGPEKQTSGYRLDASSVALEGGDIGHAILPGNSANSRLIHYVSGLDPELKMPAEGEPLTAEQVGVLRAWIDQGAAWPASADVKLESKTDHWAYRPLTKPAVPTIKQATWVRTPVDAFILAKLEAKSLTPSEPADKRTLLRRVTFDLTGLPPTPEELAAFEADSSPDALDKVVDRLLASPRYGERWARHWMDMVHFAETHGNDQDRERKNAWPYRDYLIRSFNEDKPYGRFVEEQLAADVLYPDKPAEITALGFIGAGPWDESSQQSIQNDTVDKKIAQNLDRDDMLTATMQTFASTTVHCARCHTHKFDPVTIQEYYNLQSCFAGVDRAERPYDPDPQVSRARLALQTQKKELEAGRDALAAVLLSAEAQADAALWEQSLAGRDGIWAVLDPEAFTSAGGASPVEQPDKSVLYGGAKPEKDTYTIAASSDLKGITAVRLEVLPDDSLNHKGPGRQDNGNLHLSEFRVTAAPRSGGEAKPVAIRSATADYDQGGWTAAHAIDGNTSSAWGIYPEVGKPHEIIFELKEPISLDGGATLTFTLEQVHGSGHLIGRPRLSVTTAPLPIKAAPIPPAIAAVLQVPPQQRSNDQKADLALHVKGIRLDVQLAALPPPQMVFAGASDFKPDGSFLPAKGCRPVFVLRRGDVTMPMEPAVPGALAAIPGLDATFDLPDPNDEGARRAALAKWLSDPKNVLTWRSIANRVWHYHFGKGLVDTPNDFGKMGGTPSHPELLDWLAVTFRDEHGGSLKRLHKLVVTSAAYRQSSKHNPEYAKVDADNRLLWRMNRSRLDAESVRDAILLVSGTIDLTMGGPSVKQFIETPGIHVTTNADYDGFDPDRPENRRRSVYRFIFRTLPDPFMDSMDCADASQLTPARSTSVTALQALAMLNNRFVVRYSEHLADRVAKLKPNDTPGQIDAAYDLALLRQPTADERAALSEYAKKHGMANTCRLIFNSNEFMFVN